MSANSTGPKKQCVSCNKSGGILICDGCQKNFCGKHVLEHRQELALKLDQLMQDHDLLHHDLNEISTKKSVLFLLIDKWQNESILKIQQAAQTAREDLEKHLEHHKEKLKKSMINLSTILRTSRDADDFAEPDLYRWKNALEEFQSEIQRPASVTLLTREKPSIDLIRIGTMATKIPAFITDPRDEFFEKFGSVAISDNGLLATHNGPGLSYAYLRGKLHASNCCYGIRFRIEKCSKPYRIFFGCISINSVLGLNTLRTNDNITGWFGFNQIYQQGRCQTNCQKYCYYSDRNQTNDILTLILDHKTKQIQLLNERTQTTNVLKIVEPLSEVPWRFLVVLTNPGDSVRLLNRFE